MLLRIRWSDGSGDDLLVLTDATGAPGPRRLHVAGELCSYTAPMLAAHLEDHASDADLVLDVSAVTFIDSTGIIACVDLVERWRSRGRSLRLVEPSPAVRRVVGILGLDAVLVAGASAANPGDDEPGAGPDIEVRNLDRGQTIEVTVVGEVDEPSMRALVGRLDLLAAKRQPATLRLDVAGASLDPTDAHLLADVAKSLGAFGSRLVIVGGRALEDEVPLERRGPSLVFE